jgi:alpha-glucosidase
LVGHGGDFSFTKSANDFDLEAVTAYGHKKGVNIIGHHETGGNIANYEAQLDAMKLYNRLGVPAVKTGYVADAGGIQAPCGSNPTKICMEYHDGQRQVQHHLRVVQTAAQYHIAVNAHEPVKDTGLRRTYPNWIAREGARGMEYNAWGAFANGPSHEPTLVYTRMLSGPMDFTPGILSLEARTMRRSPRRWPSSWVFIWRSTLRSRWRPISSRALKPTRANWPSSVRSPPIGRRAI